VTLLLLASGDGCANQHASSFDKTTTTIILIRHAERDNFFNITEQGRHRAIALVEAVKDMGINAIYSPDLERNLDTVRPLADHLKLTITRTPRINKSSADKIVHDILDLITYYAYY
jgi:broad specificity phosphatase PhoE